jgi:hypothetical protein
MRRASSGEECECEKTSATKSIRFGTWIVTMSGFFAYPWVWSDCGMRGPPSLPCRFSRSASAALSAKNQPRVHGFDRSSGTITSI